ncbi:MAG TPA: (d)CMP kinase, partial [Petrotogaceae bacterium]|nr:(d)CMP kinase [Petrotogaceae bacterium]
MKKLFHIAIDGPAGSGKSTVAKEISKRLGIL